jgi:hypothetical protein
VAALLSSQVGCPTGPKQPDGDPNGDFTVTDAGAGPASTATTAESYEFLQRRPLAAVGLAGEKGLTVVAVRSIVVSIADTLDACLTDISRGGNMPRGEARVVVRIGEDGSADFAVPVAADASSLAVAIRCIGAPLKLTKFPAGTGERSFAIEAMWPVSSQ